MLQNTLCALNVGAPTSARVAARSPQSTPSASPSARPSAQPCQTVPSSASARRPGPRRAALAGWLATAALVGLAGCGASPSRPPRGVLFDPASIRWRLESLPAGEQPAEALTFQSLANGQRVDGFVLPWDTLAAQRKDLTGGDTAAILVPTAVRYNPVRGWNMDFETARFTRDALAASQAAPIAVTVTRTDKVDSVTEAVTPSFTLSYTGATMVADERAAAEAAADAAEAARREAERAARKAAYTPRPPQRAPSPSGQPSQPGQPGQPGQ